MPTNREVITAKKFIENGGKSVSKAMREAGFSEAYARNPHKLTRSKGWKELLEKNFPDSLLNKKHKELLRAAEMRTMEVDINLDDNEIKRDLKAVPGIKFVRIKTIKPKKGTEYKLLFYTIPLHEQQRLSLDMLYKLKGKYAPDKFVVGTFAEFEEMSDDELEAAAGISKNDANADTEESP